MELIRRDDVPMDLIEQIQAEHPDAKLIFAGQDPDSLPQHVKDYIAGLQERMTQMLLAGLCVDCGAKIPGTWPPEENYQVPENWSFFTDTVSGDLTALQCPECGAREEDKEDSFN